MTSWSQCVVLVAWFVVLPVVIISALAVLLSKFQGFKKWYPNILLCTSLAIFFVLILLATNQLSKKLLAVSFVTAAILGWFLHKYLLKIVTFQFLLAGVSLVYAIPVLMTYVGYNSNWKSLPDQIVDTKFSSTPNIYFIQPDGYIGTAEVRQGHYKLQDFKFDAFLQSQGFTIYPHFRSNYFSTLSSNSAIFSMKHHFYNGIADVNSEMIMARANILSENAVLSVLKHNDYETHVILETPYLMTSRPNLYFDTCNIDYNEVPYLSLGFEFKRSVISDLKARFQQDKDGRHFYFIEKMLPGHIANLKSNSKGEQKERLRYLNKVEAANDWLTEIIAVIEKHDDNALIIIASDHGGFVGFDYSSEAHIKTENLSYLNSIFSSLLAIKWTGEASDFDSTLKTSVNLFRVVFSFLSEDKRLLNQMEDDASYLTLNKGTPLGIYKVIDTDGGLSFEKY